MAGAANGKQKAVSAAAAAPRELITKRIPRKNALGLKHQIIAALAVALLAAAFIFLQNEGDPPPPGVDSDSAAGDAVLPMWRQRFKKAPLTLEECEQKQHKLTYIPAVWPGFHPLCIVSAEPGRITARVLVRATGERKDVTAPDVRALLDAVKPVVSSSYGDDDPMIVASVYAYPPPDWELFSPVGEHLVAAGQLQTGDIACVYEGGQFIWPGWELGHVTDVEVPVVDERGRQVWRVIPIRTVSLRPLAFELSGFLTDAECAYVIDYAQRRLVPSPLAYMDNSDRNEEDVRTSKQTFMERGGSAMILNLEHRAHNLTRLPYALGENIQVVRYQRGQKYGAHRDFFSANDYHNQPAMLASVEYGRRNRLATVFWYLNSVEEGGETFFPRALNENGTEYNPWNGDHNDCYRGIAVKAKKGNAVLFYSLVPDGRLDERSLHGGCQPRAEGAEKWGANQWVWNLAPKYRGEVFPRKAEQLPGKDGCRDESPDCKAWADSGECDQNPGYMHTACRYACGKCD